MYGCPSHRADDLRPTARTADTFKMQQVFQPSRHSSGGVEPSASYDSALFFLFSQKVSLFFLAASDPTCTEEWIC